MTDQYSTYAEKYLIIVNDQINWYRKKSRLYSRLNNSLKLIEILSALSLPLTILFAFTKSELQIILICQSLLIILSITISAVFNFNELHLKFNAFAKILTREKYLFISSEDRNSQGGLKRFIHIVENVENLNYDNLFNQNFEEKSQNWSNTFNEKLDDTDDTGPMTKI